MNKLLDYVIALFTTHPIAAFLLGYIVGVITIWR